MTFSSDEFIVFFSKISMLSQIHFYNERHLLFSNLILAFVTISGYGISGTKNDLDIFN